MAVGTAPKVGFLERRVTFFCCFLTLDDSERRLSFRVPFVFASDVQVHWSDDCGLLNSTFSDFPSATEPGMCHSLCVNGCGTNPVHFYLLPLALVSRGCRSDECLGWVISSERLVGRLLEDRLR